MCYEYWHRERIHSQQEQEARKRAREIIEKAKSGRPAPAAEPTERESKKEPVPA